MKNLLSAFLILTLAVSAQAQSWRIYYSSPTQIQVDSASGGFAFLAQAEKTEVKARGSKIAFDFGGKALLLSPAQVRKSDSTAYGATVATVIAAFVSQADLASEQAIFSTTTTGSLDSLTYAVVEIKNTHASAASSITVGGNTISIPAGQTIKFEGIRSPATGRYKPVPRIQYDGSSSTLVIRTVKK